MRFDRQSHRSPAAPASDSGAGRRDTDDGAAAVEFALVVPVLLLLLFGLFDFGRALNRQLVLNEAAQEGARSAALGQDPTVRIAKVTGTGFSTTVTIGSTCTATSGVTADAVVTVSNVYAPVTPVGNIMQLFGGNALGTITLTAKGVSTCIG